MKQRANKIVLILLTLISLTSCIDRKEYPYTINTHSNSYNVKSYKLKDGCVTFRVYCGCGDDEYKMHTICGNYEIVKY